MTARFGVYGLAVMGQNLARNIASHGIPVAVYNRTASRTERLMTEHGKDGHFLPTFEVKELVGALERPRSILLMVKAGEAVDHAIGELRPYLEAGDVLIDGGNSSFMSTRRRAREVEAAGFRALGAGVSGGEEGALLGPSIMPGGTPEAYEQLEPVFTRIAAQDDGQPCCTYIGTDGAGHYVKMVHNGIEYADIQLIAEAYDFLRQALGLEPAQQADVFRDWNQGDLDSYLIQITAEVLGKQDPATGRPLVDVILDEAQQKGTGKWTSQNALDLGIPVTAITEAVFARFLSAQKSHRTRAAGVLPGPRLSVGEADGLVDAVRDALYASKIVAYAQGFEQMAAAAEEYGWRSTWGPSPHFGRGGASPRSPSLN